MTIQTIFEPKQEVWYFKDNVPTKTEVKAIHITVQIIPKMNIVVKYELLREITNIPEEYLFSTQQELYWSLND